METDIQRITDQLQIFQVSETKCYRLHVNVQKGENLSKGRIGDFLDTPDPYVALYVKGIPRGRKRTKTINNCTNPSWEENFKFILDPTKENVLDVSLHDDNYTVDEHFGTQSIILSELKTSEETIKVLEFENGGKIHLKLLMEEDVEPDLRYSEDLCAQEKAFVVKRKELLLGAISKAIGADGSPKDVNEVPVIGVLASGGGLRALIGYAGVLSALWKSGILDCVTYIAGLSGSSWCLAWLFSNPEFPNKGPDELMGQLRDRVSEESYSSAMGHIRRDVKHVKEKYDRWLPVSLTDVFGHLVGEMLLKERKYEVFSSVREKLKDSVVPMPICTCLSVKTDVSAKVFGEWIEFSPYEVGWVKYGVFMKMEYFGSLFYMGNIVHRFDEQPLHFLLGCWGNAFSIIPDRLLPGGDEEVFGKQTEKGPSDAADAGGGGTGKGRLPIVEEGSLVLEEDRGLQNGCSNGVEEEQEGKGVSLKDRLWTGEEDEGEGGDCDRKTEEGEGGDEEEDEKEVEAEKAAREKAALEEAEEGDEEEEEGVEIENGGSEEAGEKNGGGSEGMGFWPYLLTKALSSFGLLRTRDVRAGRVFNPLRGLPMATTKCVKRCSVTDGDFQMGLSEAVEREAKEQCLVDSGLSFNLPFPLLLRPERAVDLYLSFDFSTRPTDFHEPFEEIILAEKWAKMNHAPFPPVKKLAQKFCKEPMREMYVFEDPENPNCPVIMHFILFNGRFREFKEPGIKRATEEERDFANFDIFSDPEDNFSMFKFKYNGFLFDRLSKLMEFNTLLGLDEIHAQMKKAAMRRRNASQNRRP